MPKPRRNRNPNIGENVRCLLKSLLFILAFGACDPEGRKKCEWTLEPEPDLMDRVDPGFIPVCARNRSRNKQDCRLQWTLVEAKNFSGKTFRYTDIQFTEKTMPKTIKTIKTRCP